jgi:hypothetical protein
MPPAYKLFRVSKEMYPHLGDFGACRSMIGGNTPRCTSVCMCCALDWSNRYAEYTIYFNHSYYQFFLHLCICTGTQLSTGTRPNNICHERRRCAIDLELPCVICEWKLLRETMEEMFSAFKGADEFV